MVRNTVLIDQSRVDVIFKLFFKFLYLVPKILDGKDGFRLFDNLNLEVVKSL